ncbi:hypothetical protein [Chroococcidiopsis cubana]|nr:hypothetical protein [Chroococcidiopsis cubana]
MKKGSRERTSREQGGDKERGDKGEGETREKNYQYQLPITNYHPSLKLKY